MMFGVTSFVGAADLTYNADTTVDLSSPDIDLTIVSGSEATTVVVNAGTVVITLPIGGNAFTITSADRHLVVSGDTAALTKSYSCSSSRVETLIVTPGAVVPETITLTPDTNKCVAASGGGGGSSDTTPPTSTSISIAADAETADSVSVTLTLGATGASYMMIANDADFTDVEWETYATSKEWTLTAGDAEKTVYAKFKDSSNNASTAVSDTITLTGTGEEEAVEEETTEEETGETTTPADTITPYSEVLDGDIIQAKTSSNPFAVYIVKVVGDTKYIRHIVSLEIFNYYTHLDWNNYQAGRE